MPISSRPAPPSVATEDAIWVPSNRSSAVRSVVERSPHEGDLFLGAPSVSRVSVAESSLLVVSWYSLRGLSRDPPHVQNDSFLLSSLQEEGCCPGHGIV